jgi:hypothetical protein
MTNGCGAESCDLAAAGLAALSIIPVAAMGFFRDAVPVEAAERRKAAKAPICTLADNSPTFSKLCRYRIGPGL